MAGICAAPLSGLTTVDGGLKVDGPRQGNWPGLPGSCRIGDANGLRIDTVTGELWAPPDVQITRGSGTQTGANRVVAVTDFYGTTQALSSLALTLTAPGCGRTVARTSLQGGYAGFRAVNGNFWGVRRILTIYVNGTPVAFTGAEDLLAYENNASGVISTGGTVEARENYTELTAGQEIKAEASYSLELLAFTANALDELTWRCPQLQMILFTIPN